jgi:hypothetical protein
LKAHIKKILFKMKYLEEELGECELIYEKAKIEFFNQVRQLHHDMNVFDSALDPSPQSPLPKDSNDIAAREIEQDPKASHPKWAKKLFREIVKETHPDHFPKGIRDSQKKNLKKIYEKTVENYHKRSYSSLLESAFRLGIEVGDISDDQITSVNDKIHTLQDEISTIKNSMHWQWAHADDELKMSILKKFVEIRGWTTPSAGRNKSRKGSGTHPGKSISWARKKFKNVSDIPSHEEE